MSARLGLVTVLVPDYQAGIDFYCGVMGFTLIENTPLGGGKCWVVLSPGEGGADLLLARAAAPEQAERIGDQTGGRVSFFLQTSDFDADHARLKAAGVDFQEEPRRESYGAVAVFRDLFGNLWDLVERRD